MKLSNVHGRLPESLAPPSLREQVAGKEDAEEGGWGVGEEVVVVRGGRKKWTFQYHAWRLLVYNSLLSS